MIITWTIINNEIDFIQDILDWHLPFVDGMYFLDTGSTDGTLEILNKAAEDHPNKVKVERYHISYTTEYEKDWEAMANPFPEVEVRNFALKRAEKLFKPTWFIQLDGDEIFLPHIAQIIKQNPNSAIISGSTINPVCPLSEHPLEQRKGNQFYDPHP